MPTYTGNTRTWISTSGNWNSTSSWSGSTIPVNGDKVIFSPRASRYPVITGPSGNLDLYAFIVEDGFPANMGAAGNPVAFLADTLIYRGSGSFWYKVSGSGITPTDNMVINSPTMNNAVVIDFSNTNSLTSLTVTRGGVQVSTNGEITYCQIAPTHFTGAKVYMAPNTSGISHLSMSGGLLESYRNVNSAAIQSGGKWIQWASTSNLTVTGGVHVMNQTSSDPLNQCWLHGGQLDLTQTSDAKTISQLYKFPNGRIQYDPNKHSVTFADMSGEETR